MMYSAITVIGTLYGRGIYNDTRGGAGDFPGAAPFFFTHTLERGRRAPRSVKVNKHTLNVNRLAGAQTCGARTLVQGRRN